MGKRPDGCLCLDGQAQARNSVHKRDGDDHDRQIQPATKASGSAPCSLRLGYEHALSKRKLLGQANQFNFIVVTENFE